MLDTNILHHAIETVLPYLISILEIIGIIVVFWSAAHTFWQCLQSAFLHKKFDLQINLGHGLAMGLEFKMAAEILKTVLVQSMDELYMLGAVILIRALLSLLIHYEIHVEKKAKHEKETTTEEKHPEDAE